MTKRAAEYFKKVVSSGGRDDDDLRGLLNELEWIISPKLTGKYAEWRWDSLDGVYASRVDVIDDRTLKIFGSCILISDQTLTPLVVRVHLSDDGEISVSGRVGHRGEGAMGLERRPYGSGDAFSWDDVQIDWVFEF